MAAPRRSQAERSAGTRGLIVAAARRLFAERGYAGVGLEEVLAGLPVTKGALYRHFGDKRGLFRAAVEDAQAELAGAAGEAATDPWSALEAACDALFAALARPGLLRLACSEAALVLAPDEWNAIDEAHGMGALRRFLDQASAACLLPPDLDPEATARLLSGAIYHGAEWAATDGRAPDPESSRHNKALVEAASSALGVTARDLARAYPDFRIDPAAEERALRAHDAVVIQFPMHWYSVPAVGKHWLDVALARGFAYGPGCDAPRGKRFWVAATVPGPADSYGGPGRQPFDVRHGLGTFFAFLEQTARVCGMRWEPPFVVDGVVWDGLDDAELGVASRACAARLAGDGP